MAQFTVNAQRFDPYKNFKFRVRWDGRYVAGVSKVGSLKRTTEVVKHREGGDPSSTRKSPGRTEYEAITLERGVTHDPEFEQWANKVWNFGSGLGAEVSLKDFRKDILIEVYNEAGQLALTYKVYRCWVSEFQAQADLDANANAVLIQHIKLENEGWERDREVPEPNEPTPGRVKMSAPASAARLLDTWEQGMGQPQALQAVALLQWARPDAERVTLERLTIGQRNAELLALREQLFGPELTALAACPNCGETLDLSFRTADIRTAPPPAAVDGVGAEILHDGRRVRFRLPDTADLLAVGQVADAAVFRRAMLARCVDTPLDTLPEALLDKIVARMAEVDPAADVRLNLTCPACAHAWQAPFDIVSFLWRELDDWAGRTLREVHLLASAYGWREADILGLSAQRRQHYLDMIGG